MQTTATTTAQGKRGVPNTLATTSIQRDQMHTTIPGTKRIHKTNEPRPQAFTLTQTSHCKDLLHANM